MLEYTLGDFQVKKNKSASDFIKVSLAEIFAESLNYLYMLGINVL
jgi:hypothetical protein